MAHPNDPANSIFHVHKSSERCVFFELVDGELCVGNVPLFTEIPRNVTFKSFFSVCQLSDAPPPLFERVQSLSFKGGFLGFSKQVSSDRLTNSLGKFSKRNFLSIFRFKTLWSTQWVGNSGSDLMMETQWIMFDVPEIKSYVLIIPIIEGKFRSTLHPGPKGHVMICVESGSTQVKAVEKLVVQNQQK